MAWEHDDRFGLCPSSTQPSPFEFQVTDIFPTDACLTDFDNYVASEQRVVVPPDPDRKYGPCVVFLFGTNAAGDAVTCRVKGFEPSLRFLCAKAHGEALIEAIAKKTNTDAKTVRDRSRWLRLARTDGFHADADGGHKKFDFLEVRFVSLGAYHAVLRQGVLAGCSVSLKKKTPLIQFVLQTKVRHMHWCKLLQHHRVAKRVSHSELEVECRMADLQFVDCDANAPFYVASVDIETYSAANTTKRCNMDVPEDTIFMIGTSVLRVGDDVSQMRDFVQLVGACDPPSESDGVTVLRYDTQQKLLEGWRNLVVVDIPVTAFIGYNTFTFDYPWLFRKAEMTKASLFPYLGRLISHASTLEEVKMETAQYGKNKLNIVNAPGTFHIDIWYWLKLNKRFNSYKLDEVSKTVLGEQKDDLDYLTMFQYKATGDPAKMLIIARYCRQDCRLPMRLMLKLDILTTKIGMSRVTCTGINHLVSRGQQFKVINQICWFCEHNGFEPMQSDAVGTKYQGATVVNPRPGLYKEPLAVLDFASLYPTIMIAHNLCMSTLVRGDVPENAVTMSQKIEYTAFRDAAAGPIPAGTLNPLCGYSDTTVQIHVQEVDGMYALDPKRSQPPKKEWEGNYLVKVAGDATRYVNTAVKTNTFVQSAKGILPSILMELLSARKKTRKQMESVTDPVMYSNLNGRQLALKVSANSVYGFTGVREGALPCQEIAETVTSKAREGIELVIQKVQEFEPCDVVYGDTDSVMLKFHRKMDRNECMARGEELGPWATKLFPPPMKLEMEKVYDRFMILGKKRYAGLMYVLNDKKDVVFEKLDAKGVETVRRGISAYGKKAYAEVLNVLMYDDDLSGLLDIVDRTMRPLLEQSVPIRELVMTKELGDDYKTNNVIQLRVSQKIADRDEQEEVPIIGDRVEYVVIETDDKLVTERGEDPEYVERKGLKLDWKYYAEKQVARPICMLLAPIMEAEKMFESYLQQIERKRRGFAQIDAFLNVAPKERKRELPTLKQQTKTMKQKTLL